MPQPGDPASNPRSLGSLGRDTRVAIAHSSAIGADGRVYFGGLASATTPAAASGGMTEHREARRLLEAAQRYAVHWITPSLGGQLIAISTSRAPDELGGNRTPPEAKLFIYDIAQGKIVREIVPVAKARATGLIVEVAPAVCSD